MRRFEHEDGLLMYGYLVGLAASMAPEQKARVDDFLRRLMGERREVELLGGEVIGRGEAKERP